MTCNVQMRVGGRETGRQGFKGPSLMLGQREQCKHIIIPLPSIKTITTVNRNSDAESERLNDCVFSSGPAILAPSCCFIHLSSCDLEYNNKNKHLIMSYNAKVVVGRAMSIYQCFLSL